MKPEVITISIGEDKVLIDKEDFEKVNKFRWHILNRERGQKYVISYKYVNKKPATTWMHRLILDCPVGMYIDHKNGNGLDNRKENIRICTLKQNNANRRMSKRNTSGYKGVYYSKSHKKYCSQIKFNGKIAVLGFFKDKKLAAIAYNNAAMNNFGEFARLNEIRNL